jgi:hypothetical protein
VNFKKSSIFIKEKTMDEQTMPEQPLSAELLQQITGGCKECNRDKLEFLDHLTSYRLHSSHANLAKSNEQYDQYDFHKEKANFHADKLDKAIQRVAQRGATPGHVIVPDPQLPPGRRWIM